MACIIAGMMCHAGLDFASIDPLFDSLSIEDLELAVQSETNVGVALRKAVSVSDAEAHM